MSTEPMRIFANGDKFGPFGREEVNFYFESGKLAVSDNHRMAYWFFIRQTGKGAHVARVGPDFRSNVHSPQPRVLRRVAGSHAFPECYRSGCGDVIDRAAEELHPLIH
jgi:hypothetical protein